MVLGKPAMFVLDTFQLLKHTGGWDEREGWEMDQKLQGRKATKSNHKVPLKGQGGIYIRRGVVPSSSNPCPP